VTYRIVFRPQAEIEITEAADWYEAQRRGLGQDFLRLVDQTISRIGETPLQFRRIHKETRRAPLQRFPYGILYRVRAEEIVVVACMHARRDPKRWRDRR
jgi:plasmid stabilization system protein ParE